MTFVCFGYGCVGLENDCGKIERTVVKTAIDNKLVRQKARQVVTMKYSAVTAL